MARVGAPTIEPVTIMLTGAEVALPARLSVDVAGFNFRAPNREITEPMNSGLRQWKVRQQLDRLTHLDGRAGVGPLKNPGRNVRGRVGQRGNIPGARRAESQLECRKIGQGII